MNYDKHNVLYLSLTGILEPLGRSQVLEYLIKLSSEYNIHLITFERQSDLTNKKELEELKKIILEKNIKWEYLIYTNKYGVLSTVWQIILTSVKSYRIIKKNDVKIIHTRSLIPALIGYIIKRITSAKLIFDIRGFAIDEKADTGRIKRGSIFYKVLKYLENHIYKKSDFIVTLTNLSKGIISKEYNINEEIINVIPTCANKEYFSILSEVKKFTFKKELGFNENDKVIIHSGTIGGWYDFDSEVKLFEKILTKDKSVKFLVLNRDRREDIEKKFAKYDIKKDYYKIYSCQFKDVYKYLNISDISLFLIKPLYSKKASTPTKFAENLACYLPSVTNMGIGDMDYYLDTYSLGVLIDLDNFEQNLDSYANNVLEFLLKRNIDYSKYDMVFKKYFDNANAIKKYSNIYDKLIEEKL